MTLRTARSLAGRPPSNLPLGELLFEQTNQIRFGSPVAAVSGRLGRDVVYHLRGGKTFVRPYVRPADPKSERQREQRGNLSRVQKAWSALPAEVRAGWDAFARRLVFPDRAAEQGSGPGQNAYLRAQLYRLGWGGDLLETAPDMAPPAAVLAIEEVPAPAAMFSFRVSHDVETVTGHRLLFELTPASPTLRRKPRERELVWAGETARDSFLPLGSDGAVYVIDRPRLEVAPGERYGVRVRILTEEGLPGPAMTADLIRREALPPASADASSVEQASLLQSSSVFFLKSDAFEEVGFPEGNDRPG